MRRRHSTRRQGNAPAIFRWASALPVDHNHHGVALANGMVKLGLLVSLSMALGMIVTVTMLAVIVILSRRWLLEFPARHAARVDRIARSLEILGAAAVTLVGMLLLSAELA
jgi:ABC-type nickel/cobalt efflux system permease component RcnA